MAEMRTILSPESSDCQHERNYEVKMYHKRYICIRVAFYYPTTILISLKSSCTPFFLIKHNIATTFSCLVHITVRIRKTKSIPTYYVYLAVHVSVS